MPNIPPTPPGQNGQNATTDPTLPNPHPVENRSPFDLIQNGLVAENEGDMWTAADAFGEAAEVLKTLALHENENSRSEELSEKKRFKRKKIAELYFLEWTIYLGKARDCLIEILTRENNLDKEGNNKNGDTPNTTTDESMLSALGSETISVEESRRRTKIFQRLFAPTACDDQITDQQIIDSDDLKQREYEHRQLTIEERLAALNATLPPASGTASKEADMMARLKNLGVYVPEYSSNDVVAIPVPVSEEEQVGAIISLAKDEANFDGKKVESGEIMKDSFEYDYDEDVFEDEPSEKEQVETLIASATREINLEEGNNVNTDSLKIKEDSNNVDVEKNPDTTIALAKPEVHVDEEKNEDKTTPIENKEENDFNVKNKDLNDEQVDAIIASATKKLASVEGGDSTKLISPKDEENNIKNETETNKEDDYKQPPKDEIDMILASADELLNSPTNGINNNDDTPIENKEENDFNVKKDLNDEQVDAIIASATKKLASVEGGDSTKLISPKDEENNIKNETETNKEDDCKQPPKDEIDMILASADELLNSPTNGINNNDDISSSQKDKNALEETDETDNSTVTKIAHRTSTLDPFMSNSQRTMDLVMRTRVYLEQAMDYIENCSDDDSDRSSRDSPREGDNSHLDEKVKHDERAKLSLMHARKYLDAAIRIWDRE